MKNSEKKLGKYSEILKKYMKHKYPKLIKILDCF